jgi:hypothetical protein
METNKEPKYLKDFFIYNKRYHWFIIPTIVFYYRKDTFFETGITSPAFGMSIRWFTFFAGFQIQKNIYYNGK